MMRISFTFLVATLVLLQACSTAPQTMVPPLPPTAGPTPTPAHLAYVDWLAYQDDAAGFSIQHPLTWQQVNNEGDPPVFALQAAPGTTLLEKYMEIDVTPQATECRQMRYGGGPVTSTHATINGVDFLRETGAGLGAGNVYEWTGYSTMKGTNCISIVFVLHSANPGVYATEPPAFDEAAESGVFDQIINTFKFTS